MLTAKVAQGQPRGRAEPPRASPTRTSAPTHPAGVDRRQLAGVVGKRSHRQRLSKPTWRLAENRRRGWRPLRSGGVLLRVPDLPRLRRRPRRLRRQRSLRGGARVRLRQLGLPEPDARGRGQGSGRRHAGDGRGEGRVPGGGHYRRVARAVAGAAGAAAAAVAPRRRSWWRSAPAPATTSTAPFKACASGARPRMRHRLRPLQVSRGPRSPAQPDSRFVVADVEAGIPLGDAVADVALSVFSPRPGG